MAEEATISQWQVLYNLAQAFREVGPWQWMSEDSLFGVQDPETGKVGYCAVIGELKETYGLVVYPGSEGLVSYVMMKEIQDPRDLHFMSHQEALSLIFANSNEVSNKDKALIRELGLKFRGKNAWPVFRSMQPWYFFQPHLQIAKLTRGKPFSVPRPACKGALQPRGVIFYSRRK
ncbi:hypothetical protein SAMN00808754_1599 [Thermanaeromonas toyohensis ToBE]|uniref:DUF7309 domain-containing protein n=1 Tax=Thermanaeromonas toyohensis ToBE TaxID=698762 RepID=A0A1W1VTK4_9FIRM|nr:hypothetical protein [Thermanaeromonas toyohensis]SMB96702.1 hypothetical protein SAMN00808754_1599 [Thermanaeromonas toyohensis ToBE]